MCFKTGWSSPAAVLFTLLVPAMAAAAPQQGLALNAAPAAWAPRQGALAVADSGWDLTTQVGTGMSFYFRDQAGDPAFGFAAGRFVSDSMQVEAQILGIPGPAREFLREEFDADGLYATSRTRIQRRMYAALTRVNLHLGGGRARPYLSFGVGLGYGSERYEYQRTCVSARCIDYPWDHGQDTRQGLALATLLGTGVDIGISDRWRVRPEVIMPYLWGAPQNGFLTLTVGITYSTTGRRAPAGTRALPSHAHAGEPLTTAWKRVAALPLGDVIRVQVRRNTSGVRDGRYQSTDSSTLLGTFVAADDGALVLRVTQGARRDTWRIPRARVLRVERGRMERNGPWEGILGGFVAGAGMAALWYTGSGGGDDSEIIIPAGTLLFGGPAALLAGLTDHLHRSFEPTELTFDLRLVVPG